VTLKQTDSSRELVQSDGTEIRFGRDYLQGRISNEFPLAKHLAISVEAADDSTVVLRAPLGPNANYKGTAFGGSLYSVAVLAGWAWLTRYLAASGVAADVVIQESTVHYLAPCEGELRARALPPSPAHMEKLLKMLRRAGRGRVRMRIEVGQGPAVAASFDGVFAAMSTATA